MGEDKAGKHDADRGGQGTPQPDTWSNAGSTDDGNKHENGNEK